MTELLALTLGFAVSAAMHTSMVIVAERIFGGRPFPPGEASDAAARRWIALATLAGAVTTASVAFRFRESSMFYWTLVPALGGAAGLASMVVRPWAARWLTFGLTASNLMPALMAWHSLAAGIGLHRETAIVIAVSGSIAVVAGARGTRIAAGTPWISLPPPENEPARRSFALATLAGTASTLCLAVVWYDGPIGWVALPAIGAVAGLAARWARKDLAPWLAAILIATNVLTAGAALAAIRADWAAVSYLSVAMGVSAIIAVGAGARGIGIARFGGAGA